MNKWLDRWAIVKASLDSFIKSSFAYTKLNILWKYTLMLRARHSSIHYVLEIFEMSVKAKLHIENSCVLHSCWYKNSHLKRLQETIALSYITFSIRWHFIEYLFGLKYLQQTEHSVEGNIAKIDKVILKCSKWGFRRKKVVLLAIMCNNAACLQAP
jgi:hypothetical protein